MITRLFKSCLVKQAYNQKDKKFMLTQLLTKLLYIVLESNKNHFVTYYKETPKYAYDRFFDYSLSFYHYLVIYLPDYIGKFAVYHLHYKEKLVMTESAYNSSLFLPPWKQILLFTYFIWYARSKHNPVCYLSLVLQRKTRNYRVSIQLFSSPTTTQLVIAQYFIWLRCLNYCYLSFVLQRKTQDDKVCI